MESKFHHRGKIIVFSILLTILVGGFVAVKIAMRSPLHSQAQSEAEVVEKKKESEWNLLGPQAQTACLSEVAECGNNIVEGDEACDEGEKNGAIGGQCSISCVKEIVASLEFSGDFVPIAIAKNIPENALFGQEECGNGVAACVLLIDSEWLPEYTGDQHDMVPTIPLIAQYITTTDRTLKKQYVSLITPPPSEPFGYNTSPIKKTVNYVVVGQGEDSNKKDDTDSGDDKEEENKISVLAKATANFNPRSTTLEFGGSCKLSAASQPQKVAQTISPFKQIAAALSDWHNPATAFAASTLQDEGGGDAALVFKDFSQCEPVSYLLADRKSSAYQQELEKDISDIVLAHIFASAYAKSVEEHDKLDDHCLPLFDIQYDPSVGRDDWDLGAKSQDVTDAVVDEYAAKAVWLQLQKLAGISSGEERGEGLYYRALDQLIVNRELLRNKEALLLGIVDRQAYAYVDNPESHIDKNAPNFDIRDYKLTFYNQKKSIMLSSVEEYDAIISKLQQIVVGFGVVSGAVDRAVERGVSIKDLFSSPEAFIRSMDLPYNEQIAAVMHLPVMVEINNYYTNYRLNKFEDALNAESMMLLYAALDMEKEDWTPAGLPDQSLRLGVPELADSIYNTLAQVYPHQWGATQAKSIQNSKNTMFLKSLAGGVVIVGGIAVVSSFWGTVGLIAIEGADYVAGGRGYFKDRVVDILTAVSEGDRSTASQFGSTAETLWDWVFKGGFIGIGAVRGEALLGSTIKFAQTRSETIARRGLFGSTVRSARMSARSRAGSMVIARERATVLEGAAIKGSLSERIAKRAVDQAKSVASVATGIAENFQRITGLTWTAELQNHTKNKIEQLFLKVGVRIKQFEPTSPHYTKGLEVAQRFNKPSIVQSKVKFLSTVDSGGVLKPATELPDYARQAGDYVRLQQENTIFAGKTIPYEAAFGRKGGATVGIIVKEDVAKRSGTTTTLTDSGGLQYKGTKLPDGTIQRELLLSDVVDVLGKKIPLWKGQQLTSPQAYFDYTAQLFANVSEYASQNNLSLKTLKDWGDAAIKWQQHYFPGGRVPYDLFPELQIVGRVGPDDIYAYLLPTDVIVELKEKLAKTSSPELQKVIRAILDKTVNYTKNDPDKYGKLTEALGALLDDASQVVSGN